MTCPRTSHTSRPRRLCTAFFLLALIPPWIPATGKVTKVNVWTEEYPQDYSFYDLDGAIAVPAHRYSHAAIDDRDRGRMVVSLGYFYDHRNHRPTWLADTWGFSYHLRRWTLLHDGVRALAPSPRYGHTASLHGDRMIIFGGEGPATRDVWVWGQVFVFLTCLCTYAYLHKLKYTHTHSLSLSLSFADSLSCSLSHPLAITFFLIYTNIFLLILLGQCPLHTN